jgi:hypothetical protein
MPVAVDRLICDDIKTLIVSGSIAKPDNLGGITAADVTIDYLPRFEPADLDELKIVIAPRTRSTTVASRASRQRDLQIQVAIMQSATDDSARFTALIDMTNDIEQRLALSSVINGATYRANYVESSTQLYDIAALEQHSVFRSVITVTYRLTT